VTLNLAHTLVVCCKLNSCRQNKCNHVHTAWTTMGYLNPKRYPFHVFLAGIAQLLHIVVHITHVGVFVYAQACNWVYGPRRNLRRVTKIPLQWMVLCFGAFFLLKISPNYINPPIFGSHRFSNGFYHFRMQSRCNKHPPQMHLNSSLISFEGPQGRKVGLRDPGSDKYKTSIQFRRRI